MDITYILQGPVITEKSVRSEESRIYAFWIHRDATKIDVKNAFSMLYGRTVSSVRISSLPKKVRLIGRGKEMTKRLERKKAFVRFKEDKPLEIIDVIGSVKEKKKTEGKNDAEKTPSVKKKAVKKES